VTFEIRRTDWAGHAAELATSAFAPDAALAISGAAARAGQLPGGFDAVFTLGGDGTAMEVIGALSGRGIPVGVLPAGTANQLARYLGVPLDVARATRAHLAAEPSALDLGRLATGRRFVLTAGVGMDVAMIAGATTRAKRLFGVAAYAVSGLRALFANARHHIRATVDGVVVERECAVAMIVNIGAFFAGRLQAGPGIRPDDGQLDLCVFSARSSLEGADVLRRCYSGDFRPHRNMYFARGTSITLESDPLTVAEADGELLPAERLTAVVEAGAACLLRPRI
jgi:diacylglycerol kinase (ATP)